MPKAMKPGLSLFLLHHAMRPPLPSLAPKAGTIINKTADDVRAVFTAFAQWPAWRPWPCPWPHYVGGHIIDCSEALWIYVQPGAWWDPQNKLEDVGSLRTPQFTGWGSPQMFTHPLWVLLCISDGQQGKGVCMTFLKYVGMRKHLPWTRQTCKKWPKTPGAPFPGYTTYTL